MNASALTSKIWECPSGRRLIRAMRDDLIAGRNVVCVLPKPLLADDPVQALSETLQRDGHGHIKRVQAGDPAEGTAEGTAGGTAGDPAVGTAEGTAGGPSCLASLLKAAWNWDHLDLDEGFLESASLSDLFLAAAKDDRLSFLALSHPDSLPADDLKAWAALSKKHGSPGGGPSGLRLLVLASPLLPLPAKDDHLKIHHWWARADDADNQLVLNELYEELGIDESRLTLFWWLKSLGQGFCHDDFVLMGLILESKPKTIDGLIETLARHPLHPVAKDYRERVAAQPPQPPLRLGERPPLPTNGLLKELWAEGLILGRSGSTLHPLLMSDQQLLKAVATSQRRVLMPLVDYMLSLLVTCVEKAFGPSVWEHYEPNEDERSRLLLEIGPLAFFIQNRLLAGQVFPESLKAPAVALGHSWRYIRNTLAHNGIVKYQSLEEAFDDYRKFCEAISAHD
jgi:hypothetical protein